jgi:hypothetical protein
MVSHQPSAVSHQLLTRAGRLSGRFGALMLGRLSTRLSIGLVGSTRMIGRRVDNPPQANSLPHISPSSRFNRVAPRAAQCSPETARKRLVLRQTVQRLTRSRAHKRPARAGNVHTLPPDQDGRRDPARAGRFRLIVPPARAARLRSRFWVAMDGGAGRFLADG